MATVSIDVPVVCDTCGADVEASIDRHGVMQVVPCANCLSRERDTGHEEDIKDADTAAER